MARKAKDFSTHSTELRFIERTNPRDPGASFNGDPLCFAEHCNMQANFAESDGFPLIAEAMRNIRDTADPHYRTRAGQTSNLRDFAPNLERQP